MFSPNQQGTIKTVMGRNLDGEETYSDPQPIALAVINLLSVSQKTSVRTDSSGSHGDADEMVSDGKILTKQQVSTDDLIQVAGGNFRVKGTHPRYTVFGQFDHYEVVLELVEE